jgi:hypothetical protein
MRANETAEVVSRSVTELGRRVGLSNQEFNVGLHLAGLLGGEPGAWWFTEQGKPFATVHNHDNGYGGYAHRSFDTTTWRETVTDKVDLSEAGIARIRQFITDRTLAQKEEREAATAAADAAFQRFQAAKHIAETGQNVGSAARTKIIVGLGVAVTAYGLCKAVPLARRRWQGRAGASQPDRDRSDHDAPPAA